MLSSLLASSSSPGPLQLLKKLLMEPLNPILVDFKGGESNSPPPELSNGLNIRIICTAPFAWIIQEGAQAYQLHVSPSLLKQHLWANANVATPETKSEEQILHKVILPEYHKYADMFSEGSAKELPPHHSYNHKINLEESTSPPFGKNL
ncbi:hypothetical protein C0995_008330 [Termitomyces sp. Mi166|nr:hypothetical protein C0995_008330 [Termitomyces sp. Mi166\